MISKVVELSLGKGLVLDDLFPLKDEGLFQYLRSRFGRARAIERLLDRIENRRIYKRAYVLTRRVGPESQRTLIERYHSNAEERTRAETALAKKAALDPVDVVVYCPSMGMSLKEADVAVRIGTGKPSRLSELQLPEVEDLREKHKNLWRFYVFAHPASPESIRDLSRAAEEYFCLPNELLSLQSGQTYLRRSERT